MGLTSQGSKRAWQRSRWWRPPGCDVAQISSSGKSGGPWAGARALPWYEWWGMGTRAAARAAAQFVRFSVISKVLFLLSSCNKSGRSSDICTKEDRNSERREGVVHVRDWEMCEPSTRTGSLMTGPESFRFLAQ